MFVVGGYKWKGCEISRSVDVENLGDQPQIDVRKGEDVDEEK